MIAVTYSLELLQPLLATGLEGDPNSKRSLDYIPGSMMRGALVARYLQSKKLATLDPQQHAHQHLFLSGGARYLNAYLQTERGDRTLPSPVSWFHPKRVLLKQEPKLYDYARDPDPAAIRNRPDPQVTGVTDPFCWRSDGTVYLYRPLRRIAVHTARDRKMGRSTASEGAVFQYDALAPGQRFSGAIVVADLTAAAELKALLEVGDLWLGGARSAGYGRVHLSDVEVDEEWQEVQPAPRSTAPGGRLIVTCLSPCLVRDSFGGVGADLTAFAESLGARLKLAPGALIPDPERSRRRTVELGGFNRTWGLPTRQILAFDGGSVIVVTTPTPISADLLVEVQEAGIGEQREDGFGRVACNWQSSDTLTYAEQLQAGEKLPPAEPAIVHKELTGRMAETLLRRELDRHLAVRIQQLRLSHRTLQSDALKNSQIERFRVIARSALASGGLPRLVKFIGGLKQPAAAQFEDARFENGGGRLGQWMQHRLQEPATLWQEEFGSAQPVQPVRFGKESYALPAEWAITYTIRLIDGVLAQAARDKKERGGS